MDPFGTGQVLPPLQVPQPAAQNTIVPPLKKPPKWVRRPVGASFGVSATLQTVKLRHQTSADPSLTLSRVLLFSVRRQVDNV